MRQTWKLTGEPGRAVIVRTLKLEWNMLDIIKKDSGSFRQKLNSLEWLTPFCR